MFFIVLNPCPCGFFLNFFCKTIEFARNKISTDSGILVLPLFLSGRHGSNLTETPERNKPSSLWGLGRQTSRSFQNRWQYTVTTIRLRGQRKHAVHLQRIFCKSLWIYSCIAPEITQPPRPYVKQPINGNLMQPALNLDKAVEIVNLVNQTLLYLSSCQTCSAFSVWSICMSTRIYLIAAMNGIGQAQPQRLSSMSCNTPQTFKGIKQVGIIATFPWTKLGKLRMAEFLVHRGRVTALFNCKVEAKHTLADSTYSHTELHSNELPKTRDFCGPVSNC